MKISVDSWKDAHARTKFDTVVVFKFDRFGRSTSHLIRSLETFRALGVDFISISESVDTSTPMGKMMFTLLSAFAEFERATITERINAGLDRCRRKGIKLGRKEVIVSKDRVAEYSCRAAPTLGSQTRWAYLSERFTQSRPPIMRRRARPPHNNPLHRNHSGDAENWHRLFCLQLQSEALLTVQSRSACRLGWDLRR
jgi:hypothetical protein